MESNNYNKEYYQKNKKRLLEKANTRYTKNKDSMNLQRSKWYFNNKERQLKNKKIWEENNKHLVNSYAMKRHASKKQRIPKWLNDDEIWMIEQAYEISALRTKILGIEHHVDHIIPLQGKLVSGLHVPWNLQVITAQENKMKSNRLQGV